MKIANYIEKWWFWILASFLLYANTLKHEYVIDDLIVVTGNRLTQEGVSAVPEIFSHSYLYGYDGREDESYRPLTLTTFALERSFFDADPFFSHLIHVLLYGLTILVLFRLLTQIFDSANLKWAFAVAFLFMLHPIHTEVVANVKSRDELLCALFLFSSLHFFLKAVRSVDKKWLVLSLLTYFMALISKETAAPALLLFPGLLWFIEKKSFIETVKSSALFLVPIVLYIGIRSLVLSDVLIADPIDPVANSLVLAESGIESFSTNLSIFARYIQLSIFPIQMSWDYSLSAFPLVGFGDTNALIGLVFLLGLLAVLISGIFKRHLAGFGALIFIASFAVTSNFFFLINCVLGERFLFIPVLGVLLILVPYFANRLKNLNNSIILLIFGLLSIYFSVRTVLRNSDWKNNIRIYEAGAKVVPNSVKVQFNLGTAYLTQGNLSSDLNSRSDFYEKALNAFDQARKIYPNYVNIYENEAYVFGELSKIQTDTLKRINYLEKGNRSLAFALDSLELEKDNLNQNRSFILTELIALESDQKKRQAYLELLLVNVRNKQIYTAEDFHNELYALYELNRNEHLIQVAAKKIVQFPEKADLMAEISKQYFSNGQLENSLALLNAYLSARPEDYSSLSNKGMLLEMLGRNKEALLVYEQVLTNQPDHQHARQLCEQLKQRMK
jgi:tetratricopeptide (TPR) repeat protein